MIFAIAKFISRVFGLDISRVQRWVVVAFLVIAGVAVLALGLWVRSCFVRDPQLNHEQNERAKRAIAEQDRREMIEVLAESDTAEQRVDSNIKLAEEATEQAKKSYADKTNEELAAELERRAKQE